MTVENERTAVCIYLRTVAIQNNHSFKSYFKIH